MKTEELNEGGIGIFGFAVLAIFQIGFSVFIAVCGFSVFKHLVFAKTLTDFGIWYPMRFSVFPIWPIWVSVSFRSERQLYASTYLE